MITKTAKQRGSVPSAVAAHRGGDEVASRDRADDASVAGPRAAHALMAVYSRGRCEPRFPKHNCQGRDDKVK